MPVLGVFGRLLIASASFEALPTDATAFINPTFSPFYPSTQGFRFENPQGGIVAVLRLSKALQSRSAAFGKFINPTLNGKHAARRALRPPKCFWVSFCYDFPEWPQDDRSHLHG